ncbi:hypothetical protein SSX86_002906 [Deinandra increscens subsp. villosa]|uniref:F-box domain-containing protein n=1 Tax=Deinandra increscens subsp. villosa TaxID=3103831 RepID=A0AAP0DXC0_9ASTR
MSGEVSNDLLVDIFERLPPKSVIQLRSLSKYWHSRIATPEFVRNYNLRHSKNPDQKVLIRHLTYCGNYEFKDIYTLHDGDQLPLDPGSGYTGIPGVEFPHGTKQIIGSCNGILCLQDNRNNICLWNVSIRRELIVPSCPLKSSSHTISGFGFDPIAYDYKVVAIPYSTCYKSHENNNTFIYSLKTDSWSRIPSPSSRFYNMKSEKACFFNGILHWVVEGYVNKLSTEDPKDHTWSCFILTLDLSTCVFGHIVFRTNWRIKQLTTVNGCLTVVCLGLGSWEGGDCWIMTMKEYGNTESWCKLYKLDIKEAFDLVKVLQLPVRSDGGDLVAYYEGSKVYNPETKMETKVLKFGPYCFNLEMEAYVGSLELLDKERATTCGETIFSWTKEDNNKRLRLSQDDDDDDDGECSVLNYTF